MPRLSGRDRDVGTAEVLVIEHPPAEHAELEQRDRDDDEDEDEGHRRTQPDPVHGGALEERVEDEERDCSRGIQRSAVRKHVDLGEGAHRADCRDDTGGQV